MPRKSSSAVADKTFETPPEIISPQTEQEQLITRVKESTSVPKAAAPRRTITNWMSFVKANVAPKKVRVHKYREFFRFDDAPHVTIIPTADKIISKAQEYMNKGENIGLEIDLGRTRQGWPGWAKIQDAGIEMVHFMCDVCGKEIPFHPQHILRHFPAHRHRATGKLVRGGRFCMALGIDRSISESEAYLEDMPDFDFE